MLLSSMGLFNHEASMQTIETLPAALTPTYSPEPAMSAHLAHRIQRDYTDRWDKLWGGRPLLNGRNPGANSVRLNGNDYLGLTGHPAIVQAQLETLKNDTNFVIQSSVFLHSEHPVRDLERSMAHWLGKEDGLICQSGYAANVGLIQSVADEKTPVYLDTLAHASLWEGARAAGAPAYAFRHNDAGHLDRMMAKHGPGLVVVDSVYSTTGAMCPLVEILEITEKHSSMILVDESHSLGTHGPGGAGLCVELGISHRVHFITASLAKAFAGRAGFFTVSSAMRSYIVMTSFPTIFSSCLLPHEIAGLAATLEVIKNSDAERQRLMQLTQRLRTSLTAMGYPIHQGTQQIIALEAGTEPDAMNLRDLLEDRDVFGAIFCAPATSRNRAMVRLTLSSALTDAEIEHVEKVALEILPLANPQQWPIARRYAAQQNSEA
jgi:CAI-1 autoinducer synthase